MAFAVWLTGPPGAGKSTIADALFARGIEAARLESDVLLSILMPKGVASDEDRDVFYNAMLWVGSLLVGHGVSVVFDATAAQRRWRDRARHVIERFLEVHVTCPKELLFARVAKKMARSAQDEHVTAQPAATIAYEPPRVPDLVVHTDREAPEAAAERIQIALKSRGWF